MCTLIYWAKLVPLLHINIDEGGEEALEVGVLLPFNLANTSGGERRGRGL